MAALTETGAPALLDLREVRAPDLEPLLTEEVSVWRSLLDWDFQPSADLVRRFVGIRALNGFALTSGRELIGYSYFVLEESKGLVGDLYVRQQFRCAAYEDRLLEAAVDQMSRLSRIQRVEAQLMHLPDSLERPVPFLRNLTRHRRDLMALDCAGIARLPQGRVAGDYRIEPWSRRMQEPAARVIAAAYADHIDSNINDQYRTVAGARRFLLNVVQYPGCGTFFQPGSWLAVDTATGELAGISLASLVAPEVGHITQICIVPEARGRGLGYELLRQTLDGLAARGCHKVSLTVTAANREAITLYERTGFRVMHSFAAYVWEGFR